MQLCKAAAGQSRQCRPYIPNGPLEEKTSLCAFNCGQQSWGKGLPGSVMKCPFVPAESPRSDLWNCHVKGSQMESSGKCGLMGSWRAAAVSADLDGMGGVAE